MSERTMIQALNNALEIELVQLTTDSVLLSEQPVEAEDHNLCPALLQLANRNNVLRDMTGIAGNESYAHWSHEARTHGESACSRAPMSADQFGQQPRRLR